MNGYYAQGVGPETAVLAAGWQSRLHRIQNGNTHDRVGYCLDVLDLFLAKAKAGREKDREFCSALMQYGYVQSQTAQELVTDMPIGNDEKKQLRARIQRWAKRVSDSSR